MKRKKSTIEIESGRAHFNMQFQMFFNVADWQSWLLIVGFCSARRHNPSAAQSGCNLATRDEPDPRIHPRPSTRPPSQRTQDEESALSQKAYRFRSDPHLHILWWHHSQRGQTVALRCPATSKDQQRHEIPQEFGELRHILCALVTSLKTIFRHLHWSTDNIN